MTMTITIEQWLAQDFANAYAAWLYNMKKKGWTEPYRNHSTQVARLKMTWTEEASSGPLFKAPDAHVMVQDLLGSFMISEPLQRVLEAKRAAGEDTSVAVVGKNVFDIDTDLKYHMFNLFKSFVHNSCRRIIQERISSPISLTEDGSVEEPVVMPEQEFRTTLERIQLAGAVDDKVNVWLGWKVGLIDGKQAQHELGGVSASTLTRLQHKMTERFGGAQ
mgnify:CR=1 FL=1